MISSGQADCEIKTANKTLKSWLDIPVDDNDSSMKLLKEKLEGIKIGNDSLIKIIAKDTEDEQRVNIKMPTRIAEKRSFEAACNKIELEGQKCKLTIIKDQTDFEELTKQKMNDKFQKILIASVTHEIRTPLNIQLGMLEMIADPNCRDKMEDYIDISKKNLQLLTYFVNDIPDLSRTDLKDFSPNYSHFSVFRLLAECEELARYQIDSKKLEYKLNISPNVDEFIDTDKDRYRRIALNLLLNAVKYTYQGYIELILEKRPPNILVTTIVDTGIGIGKDVLNQLFKLNISEKDVEHTANPQGIGLGLTMCKKIAVALGGDIEVQSELGVGSKFSFWIVDHTSEERKEIRANDVYIRTYSGVNASQGIRRKISTELGLSSTECSCFPVLIVDDEPMNIFVIQSYMRGINKKGDEATNGIMAIEKANDRAKSNCCKGYKLIFMDLNMPILDGIDTSKRLTADMKEGKIPMTPIIAVTAAEETPLLKEKLIDAGICRLVQKPMTKAKFKQIAKEFNLYK